MYIYILFSVSMGIRGHLCFFYSHDNRLPADDSHVISYLTFSKIKKDVAKFVVCCSRAL